MYKTPFLISQKKWNESIHYYSWKVIEYTSLTEINEKQEQVFVIPFSQARENGYSTSWEEKIISIIVDNKKTLNYDDFSETFNYKESQLEDSVQPFFSKKEYTDLVWSIVTDEIWNGEWANFLIAQKISWRIKDFEIEKALSLFKKIVDTEYGYYLAFLFFDGEKIFIWASPERNVTATLQRDNSYKVRMNPISGTFRKKWYHNYREFKKSFIPFLQDQKEINELLMASDEELKMMSHICPKWWIIVGPILKEMSQLIHTEYLLSWQTDTSKIDILKKSMWASTLVWSPLKSAFTIIKKYEPYSRKYYWGAICHIDWDNLDSAIMIRTLQLDIQGNLEIYVGASLVKDSQPLNEYEELQTKITWVMSCFNNKSNEPIQKTSSYTQDFYLDDEIQEILQERNQYLSKLWFFKNSPSQKKSLNKDITIHIINNDDDFTVMLQHMLHILNYKTQLYPYSSIWDAEQFCKWLWSSGITLLWPWPWNPLENSSKNLINLKIIECLEKDKKKYFGICLWHQLICRHNKITVCKKQSPSQWEQIEIDLFWEKQKVGFYNTFSWYIKVPFKNKNISLNKESWEVYALQWERFFSFQFHPESILTQDWIKILEQHFITLWI